MSKHIPQGRFRRYGPECRAVLPSLRWNIYQLCISCVSGHTQVIDPPFGPNSLEHKGGSITWGNFVKIPVFQNFRLRRKISISYVKMSKNQARLRRKTAIFTSKCSKNEAACGAKLLPTHEFLNTRNRSAAGAKKSI